MNAWGIGVLQQQARLGGDAARDPRYVTGHVTVQPRASTCNVMTWVTEMQPAVSQIEFAVLDACCFMHALFQ